MLATIDFVQTSLVIVFFLPELFGSDSFKMLVKSADFCIRLFYRTLLVFISNL